MKTRHLILAALFTGIAGLAGCRQDGPAADATTPQATTPDPAATGALETPPPMAPGPDAPAASVQVTEVQLGTEAAPDRRIASPQTSFAADTGTIVAAITTFNSADGETMGTLAARWTYQDGQLVDESSETVAFNGQDVTNFRIHNPDAWPTGTYTLEVSIDGEVVETREFTVD